MTNFGQVFLFSNLITVPIQWCAFWVGVVETQLFSYWFQDSGVIKISKGMAMSKKGRIKYQGGAFFSNQNVYHILFLFVKILH